MGEFFLKHKIEILLFLMALFIRIAVLGGLVWWESRVGDFDGNPSSVFPVLSSDGMNYQTNALNILKYGTISSSVDLPIVPDGFRTPGYPMFMAGILWIFANPFYVSLAQIFLGSLAVVLLYKTARIFFDKNVSLISSAIFALEPASVFYSTLIFSETLYVFLFLLSVYFFIKPSSNNNDSGLKAFSGLFLGLSVLTKPVGQFMPIIFILLYFLSNRKEFTKDRYISIGLFIAGFIIVILPWSIRNYLLSGSVELSSISGINLFFYSMLFYAYKHQVSFSETYDLFFSQLNIGAASNPIFYSLENIKALKEIALGYIKEDFFGYMKFHLIKTIPFFLTDGLRSLAEWIKLSAQENRTIILDLMLKGRIKDLFLLLGGMDRNIILFLIGFPIWFLINIFMVIGAVKSYASRNKPQVYFAVFSSMLIIYFAVLTGPVANARYRIPAEPFMFVLAVYGAKIIIDKIRSRSHER